MEDRYEKLSDWLSEYSPIGSWLYFNVTNMDPENTSLNSVPGNRYVTLYNDGSKECQLNFAIDLVKYYDEGTSNTNQEAMKECLALQKWCEEQTTSDNVPDFDGCIVSDVEILSDVPSLLIDPVSNNCKYQILGRVNFLELKED